MSQQDDPEARIRALEPTELGAENSRPSWDRTGHPAPPPLPPPTQQWPGQHPYGADPYSGGYGTPAGTPYVTPYPSTPSGSGIRAWMVAIPAVVLLLVLAGGAVVLFRYANTSTPGAPSISGGGDVLTDEPAIPSLPSLPSIGELPTAAAPTESAPGPGSTVTISGIGANKSVTCNENVVIISGANNTVDITGHCIAVTVSGFENVITAESAEQIAVSGFDNEVTYRSGQPRVSESGSRNTVTQG